MGYRDPYSECIWRQHPFFTDLDVSDDGRVISYKSGNAYELKPSDNGHGYYTVSVGARNPRYIHRLVAETYLPNPNDYPEVNHKNGNKKDNRVSNLEWCTREYNKRHACKFGLRGDLETVQVLETGETFISHAECARAIGGTPSGIHDCKVGRRPSHRGLHFKFFSDNASDISERAYYHEIVCGRPYRHNTTPIIAIDLWTGEEAYFDSVSEAAYELDLQPYAISTVLTGKQYRTGHYRFEYAGREEVLLYGDEDNKFISWIRMGIR